MFDIQYYVHNRNTECILHFRQRFGDFLQEKSCQGRTIVILIRSPLLQYFTEKELLLLQMFATGIEITLDVPDDPTTVHLEPVLGDRGVDNRILQPKVVSSDTSLPQDSVKLLDK